MTMIKEMFSIYIVLVMLAIGLYMAFVQSGNLINVDNMQREGLCAKVIGWVYVVISVIGFVIINL